MPWNELYGTIHIDGVNLALSCVFSISSGTVDVVRESLSLLVVDRRRIHHITTDFDGVITGWTTSTMSDDFSSSTFTREGSLWEAGSFVDGHFVKENAYVQANGNIDSKYYQKTAGEIIGGVVAAVGVGLIAVTKIK